MELSAKFFIYIAVSIILHLVFRGNAQKTISVVDYGAIGDGRTDDTQAFLKGWTALCGATEGTPVLSVPSGKNFLLKSLIFEGPCKARKINFKILGNIVAPSTIQGWGDYSDGTWLKFSNVDGLILNGFGQINGRGSAWWYQAQKLDSRPTALRFQSCNDLELSGLTHLNSPRNHISVDGCTQVTISDIHIIAPGDSPNTDGIDISSSNKIVVQNSLIGTGDDCIAINSECSSINITKTTCGPGHGISVGSLGKDGSTAAVEDVHVTNCTFKGTENGARIKTWQGGSGYARNITFEDITVMDTQNPIIIDQYYCDTNSNSACKNQTSAVKISDVTFKGIRGSSATEQAIVLKCSRSMACTDVNLLDINLVSSKQGKNIFAECFNAVGKFALDTPKVTCPVVGLVMFAKVID